MAKSRAADPLRSFHDDSVLTLAGLHRWLARSARRPDRVRPVLEESHARWLGAVRSSCGEFAAAHGPDFARVFRNLLASAAADDLDFWRHALDSGALGVFGARDALDTVLRVAEERAPARRKRFISALQALACASKSDPAALTPLVEGLWPVALALGRHLPAETAPAFLATVAQSASLRSRGPARRIARAFQQLVSSCPRAALDLEAFDRVPQEVLAELADPLCLLKRSAVAKHARREARRKLDAQRRSAFISKHKGAALQALEELVASEPERRTKAWPALRSSLAKLASKLDSRERDAVSETISGQLCAQMPKWLAISPAPAATLTAIRAMPFGRASALLGFLGLTRRKQCRVRLADVFGDDDLEASIDPRFEAELVAAATAEYLRSRRARSVVWHAWGIDDSGDRFEALRARQWRHVFLTRRTLSPDDWQRALQWFERAANDDRGEFLQIHASGLMARVADRAFVERVMEDQQFATAAMLLGGDCVRRCMAASRALGFTPSTDEKAAGPTPLSHLLEVGFGSPAGTTCIADRLAADGPRRLGVLETIDLLGRSLSVRRLSMILAGTAGRPLARASLAKVVARARKQPLGTLAAALHSLLDDRKLGPVVSAAIWRSSRARSSADAIDLLKKDPQHFAAHAAAHLPAADLLIAAIRSRVVAKHIGGKLAPADLRAALPEIRRRITDERELAIAELIVFSDSNEILHLKEIQRVVAMNWECDPGTKLDDRYRTYEIPKRSGGTRMITAPDDGLKRLQRRLLAGAFERVPLHAAAHGFRKGRSILTNARVHVGKRLVVNVDIKGFFPNTLYPSVLAACMKVDRGRISASAALLLAEICCYRGALPTGSPTSPAIGNIVLRRADRAIAKAAKANRISYTRYADDLTFSGGSDAKKILPFVRKVLGECGYSIDGKKTQLYRRGRQQLVTNLVVNDRANLRRSDRRRLRAAVDHRCAGKPVVWHNRPMEDAELRGRLALLAMINRDEARAHMDRLKVEATGWAGSRG